MITVTFSGSPAELIELFQSNGFLDAVKSQMGNVVDTDEPAVPVCPVSVTPSEASNMDGCPVEAQASDPQPVKNTVTRGCMVRAAQEYAGRMHNKYNGKEQVVDVCKMCAALIHEVTDGKATKTSAVPDEYIDKVFNAAKANTIPREYAYLKEEN